MDKDELLSKLKKNLSGKLIQAQRFGRGEIACLWVDAKKIADIAEQVSSDPEIKLDWLEDLSVMQMDESIVLSYILRSSLPDAPQFSVVLRASVVPKDESSEVEVPSVASTWRMAVPMESEAGALFGIRFGAAKDTLKLLPSDWQGFPLRKNYVYPKSVMGITHGRPVGQSQESAGST